MYVGLQSDRKLCMLARVITFKYLKMAHDITKDNEKLYVTFNI